MRKFDLVLGAVGFVCAPGARNGCCCSNNILNSNRLQFPNRIDLRMPFESAEEVGTNYWQTSMSTLGNDFSINRRPWGRLITSLFRVLIAYIARFIMKVMNKTYLHDPEENLKLLFERSDDIGLLSISNHQSIMDDPGIWCGVIPVRKLRLKSLRTILMAEEWFYFLGGFSANILFGLNCLPIRRGRSLKSFETIPALKEMHRRLNGIAIDESNSSICPKGQHRIKKEWVHIMIEGRLYQSWRFQPNEPKLGKPFKKGAAKVIACSPPQKTIVLPIYHRGMDDIFPEEKPKGWEIGNLLPGKTKSFFPKWGKRVDVYVGDPIYFCDLIPREGYPFEENVNKNILDAITIRLYEAMLKLETKASLDRQLR